MQHGAPPRNPLRAGAAERRRLSTELPVASGDLVQKLSHLFAD
jgi:hypothetical protein